MGAMDMVPPAIAFWTIPLETDLLLDPDLPDRINEAPSARRRVKSQKAGSARKGPRNGIDLERIEVEGSNVDTVVPPEGFEPSTSRSGGARSNPLSYEGTRAIVARLRVLLAGSAR